MAPARSSKDERLAHAMGARLRARRNELGLKLSEAARRASVSASYLTAVENGTSTASLAVLSRIAHALDLTIGEFLAAETSTTVMLDRLDGLPGARLVSSDSLQLQVVFQVAEPGDSGTCPLDLDDTSVVAFVRSGTIELIVDDEPWLLGEGDSLHAQSPGDLTWNAADASSVVIWAGAPIEKV